MSDKYHIQNNIPTAYTERGDEVKEPFVKDAGLQVRATEIGDNDSQGKQLQRVFKVNYSFLILYALIASMGMFQLGYVYTAANQAYSVLDIKFGIQNDKATKKLYHTLIGSSAVLGAAIGSILGGKLIQYGRRKMMLLFNFVAIIAVLMTLFLNVYSICFGRILFGICGGIFGVALPRMIEETVPAQLLGSFGIITNLSVNTGSLMAILMGIGLPDSDAEKAETNFWRVIFGLPWVFQALTIPALLFVLKEDSIKFLLNNNQEKEAIQVIKKVYDQSENHEEILQYIKQTSSKPKNGLNIPLKEAVLGEQYWRATWFCVGFIIMGQFTGVNAISWYSTTILANMQGSISPKFGTVLIGLATFTGALGAMFPAKYFGRKTLVFSGHCFMGVILILVGVFNYITANNAALAMILIFLVTYQLTDGSITYLYVSEVVVDNALGFCFLSLKGTALIISLTTEYLMDSPLKQYGAFWLYGGLASIGAVYVFVCMKETRGLTDKEKKQLYCKENIIAADY